MNWWETMVIPQEFIYAMLTSQESQEADQLCGCKKNHTGN